MLNKQRSKSISEIRKSSSFNSLTALKREEDFEKELERWMEELGAKREKMYSCVELFSLMQSNNMLLRCMQHNNVLTLYCLTERKVLCVNCIYGVTRHRTHKIVPLKDCAEEIYQDNQHLKKMLDQDLKLLEGNIRACQDNHLVFDRELKKTLADLEAEYKRKSEQLRSQFEKQTEEAARLFEPMIEKSKALEKGIEELKFKIWETLSKVGLGKRSDPNNNDNEVIRQVYCASISEITKITVKKITPRQLEKLKLKKSKLNLS